MQVAFSGRTIQEVALQAREFATTILGPETSEPSNEVSEARPDLLESSRVRRGYRPAGVGQPRFGPVDDGTEWADESVIADWVKGFTRDGRRAVELLATKGEIDPRREAQHLGWSGNHWAGVWTGPRKQAGLVMRARRLNSWPYGHTYVEPRRLWMHPTVAEVVLKVLKETPNFEYPDMQQFARVAQEGGALTWLVEEPELYSVSDGEPA